jgi:hypothetical protein
MIDFSYFNVILRWLQIVATWLHNVTGYKKDKIALKSPFNGDKNKFLKNFFVGNF